MNLLNKYNTLSIAAKASIWAMLANVIQRASSVLATPIFTRILTPEEYAQYSLYQSWHDILIIFATLNVFNYATYSALIKYDDKYGFITSAQTLVTLLTIICFGLYYIINALRGDVIGFPIIIVILMLLDILFTASFNLWAAKERYDFKYKLMTLLSVAIGVLGPVFGIIEVYISKNPGYGRIYGTAAVNIAVGAAIYFFNICKSKKFFVARYWKFIILYCVPLIPHFLSTQILSRADRIMIDKMCGASQTAVYSLAYSLSTLMLIVNDAILKSFTPWTYKAIQSGHTENIKKTSNHLLLLVAIFNILLILFAPEAIKIFATEEYYEAIYIIPAVSASVYYMFLFNMFANIEYYYSETTYVAIASISAAVLNIVLNYIFIGKFGYIAAGYTTLVTYIIYAAGHYVAMNVVVKKHRNKIQLYDNKFIFLASLIFTAISIFTISIYDNTLVRYLMIVITCLVIYIHREKIIRYIKISK